MNLQNSTLDFTLSPSVLSDSGRVAMKIQASPTSRATTRLTVTHGWRIWCSDPGGLEEKKESVRHHIQASQQDRNIQRAHHNVVFWVGYRLIRSLVICWLRESTNAEKYTAQNQKNNHLFERKSIVNP